MATSSPTLDQLSIEALPDEILVKIFQLLPLLTKICVLPQVCKTWKRISTDAGVLSIIDFRNIPDKSINKSMDLIIDIMKANKNLRPIKLIFPILFGEYTDNHDYKKIIHKFLRTGSDLGIWKSLIKFTSKDKDIEQEVFFKFLSNLNNEIFYELSINYMTPQKMSLICQHLTNLQRFMIWDRVNAESLRHLVTAGSNMKYLKELRISVQDDVPVQTITNILKNHKENLELLTLIVYPTEIFCSFVNILSLCRNLIYLSIFLAGDIKYSELCMTISSLIQLQQLNIYGQNLKISRTNQDSLFQNLKNLHHVYVCIPDLQDHEVMDLCKNCGHCLETIHLNWCSKLNDTTVESILTYCKKIVALRFKWCDNINHVNLIEKLTVNLTLLPNLVSGYLMWNPDDWNELSDDVLSKCLAARPQLFLKTYINSIDKYAASLILYKILGPKCHHRKRLIRNLTEIEFDA